jgi:hypothetical protein
MQPSQWVGKQSPRPKNVQVSQVERESHVDGFFFFFYIEGCYIMNSYIRGTQ